MTSIKFKLVKNQTRYSEFDQKIKQIQSRQIQKLVKLQKHQFHQQQNPQILQTSKSNFGVTLPHKIAHSLARTVYSQPNTHYKQAINQKHFNIRGNYSHSFQDEKNSQLQRKFMKRKRQYCRKQKTIKFSQLQQKLEQRKKYFCIKNNYDNCIASLQDKRTKSKLQEELSRSKEKNVLKSNPYSIEKITQQKCKNTQIKFHLQNLRPRQYLEENDQTYNPVITNLRFIKPLKLPSKLKNTFKKHSFLSNIDPPANREDNIQCQQELSCKNSVQYKFKESYIKKISTRQINRMLEKRKMDHNFLQISVSPVYQLCGWN